MYRVAKIYPMIRETASNVNYDSVPFVDVIEVDDARVAYEYAALQNTEYAVQPDLRSAAPVFKSFDSASEEYKWHSPHYNSTAMSTPDTVQVIKFVPYLVTDRNYSIRAVNRNVNVDPGTQEHVESPIFAYPSYNHVPLEIATALCEYWNLTHPIREVGALTDPVRMTYYPEVPVV